jgi:hypothetical protein
MPACRETAALTELATRISLSILSLDTTTGIDIRLISEKLHKVLKKQTKRRPTSRDMAGYTDSQNEHRSPSPTSKSFAAMQNYGGAYNPYQQQNPRTASVHPGFKRSATLDTGFSPRLAAFDSSTSLNPGFDRAPIQPSFDSLIPTSFDTTRFDRNADFGFKQKPTALNRPGAFRVGTYGEELFPTPTSSQGASSADLQELFGGLSMSGGMDGQMAGLRSSTSQMQAPRRRRTVSDAKLSAFVPTQLTASLTQQYFPLQDVSYETMSPPTRSSSVSFSAYRDIPSLYAADRNTPTLSSSTADLYSPALSPYDMTPRLSDMYDRSMPSRGSHAADPPCVLTVEVHAASKLRSSRRPFVCSIVRPASTLVFVR